MAWCLVKTQEQLYLYFTFYPGTTATALSALYDSAKKVGGFDPFTVFQLSLVYVLKYKN
jgi:hypothetical protein